MLLRTLARRSRAAARAVAHDQRRWLNIHEYQVRGGDVCDVVCVCARSHAGAQQSPRTIQGHMAGGHPSTLFLPIPTPSTGRPSHG